MTCSDRQQGAPTGVLFASTIAFLALVLALLLPESALAGAATGVLDEQIFTPRPDDTSRMWLDALFPGLMPGGNAAAQTGMGEVLRTLNAALIAVSAAFIAYNIVVTTMNTAQDGEALGRKVSSLWAPTRVVAGMALMVPLASGYTAIQVLMVTIATWGIGLANALWNAALGILMLQGGALAQVTPPKADDFLKGMLQSLVCERTVNLMLGDGTRTGFIGREVTALAADGRIITPKPLLGDGWGGGTNTASVALVWNPDTGRAQAPVCGAVQLPTYATMVAETPAVPAGTTTGSRFGRRGLLPNVPPGEGILQGLAAGNREALGAAGMAQVWMANLGTVEGMLGQVADNIAAAVVYRADPALGEVFNLGAAGAQMAQARTQVTQAAYAQAQTAWQAASASVPPAIEAAMRAGGWISAGSLYQEIGNVQSALLRIAGQVPQTVGPSSEGMTTTQAEVLRSALALADEASRVGGVISLSSAVRSSQVVAGAAGQPQARDDLFSHFFPQALDRGISKELIDWGMAASSNGWSNPIAELSSLGHRLLWGTSVALGSALLGGSFLSGIANVVTGGGFSSMVSMLSVPVGVAILALISAGIFLAYVLPMLPFLTWTVAVIAWLILVCEAIVAAPLWAFAHLRLEGDGVAGESAHVGYRLALSVFLRPALMVVGFVLGMSLFLLIAAYVNATFFGATRLAMGNDSAGIWGWVAFACMGAAVNIYMLERCISLIHVVPDRILRWIGGYGENLDEAQGGARIAGMVNTATNKIEANAVNLAKRPGGGRGKGGGGDAPKGT